MKHGFVVLSVCALLLGSCGGKNRTSDDSPPAPSPTAPTPPAPTQECITYPTGYTLTSTALPTGQSLVTTYTCAFDRAAATARCVGTGTSEGCMFTITDTRVYASVADFVDAYRATGKVTQVRSSVSVALSGNCLNISVAFTQSSETSYLHDAQNRLIEMRTLSAPAEVAPNWTDISVFTYTSWDAQGRPTAGTLTSGRVNSPPDFTTQLAISYDPWTMTTTTYGVPGCGTAVQTATFDSNRNLLRMVFSCDGTPVAAVDIVITSTTSICK